MRFAILLAVLASIAVFAQTKEVRRTLPLSGQGHLAIDTFKGDVHVTTWDQPQVEVYARIEADGTSPASLRLANETDVKIDATGDTIRLKSDTPQSSHWNWSNDDERMPFVRYTIRMPRSAELRIKDFKSDIEVSGLAGALNIDTFKGETRVHQQSGEIRMQTFKGHGTFEMAALVGHNLFDTYKGEFDIRMPSGSGFDVVSEGGRRASIHSTFPFVLPAGSYTRESRFTARVNGGGPEVVLKSYKGDVNLH
jgi:DUF4097 and DUF4098 domain-containing protein YvlB